MVFNSPTTVGIFFALGFIWISIVSVVVYRLTRHYNQLTKGVSKVGLRDILTSILGNQSTFKKRIDTLEYDIKSQGEEGKFHIQRIGIVKFNPFSDTGGAQSFTLAILDGSKNGIVMTSLYARSGNRWYVKEIREGRGKDMALSKEEEVAIRKASPIDSHE